MPWFCENPATTFALDTNSFFSAPQVGQRQSGGRSWVGGCAGVCEEARLARDHRSTPRAPTNAPGTAFPWPQGIPGRPAWARRRTGSSCTRRFRRPPQQSVPLGPGSLETTRSCWHQTPHPPRLPPQTHGAPPGERGGAQHGGLRGEPRCQTHACTRCGCDTQATRCSWAHNSCASQP